MSGEKTRDKDADPGFAGRWSRLKQEAKAEPPERPAETSPETAPEAPPDDSPADDDRPDEKILEELGLPDPDTLKPGDDFTRFMSRAVPARLRTRALRKLWLTNPVLANLDELIDYGEDYTDAANVIENLQTAYEAGKGFAGKAAELARAQEEAEAQERADSAADSGEESDRGNPESETAETDESETPTDQPVSAESTLEKMPVDPAPEEPLWHQTTARAERDAQPESSPVSPSRQRMRFRVAED